VRLRRKCRGYGRKAFQTEGATQTMWLCRCRGARSRTASSTCSRAIEVSEVPEASEFWVRTFVISNSVDLVHVPVHTPLHVVPQLAGPCNCCRCCASWRILFSGGRWIGVGLARASFNLSRKVRFPAFVIGHLTGAATSCATTADFFAGNFKIRVFLQ
jgi:hypothetical protein